MFVSVRQSNLVMNMIWDVFNKGFIEATDSPHRPISMVNMAVQWFPISKASIEHGGSLNSTSKSEISSFLDVTEKFFLGIVHLPQPLIRFETLCTECSCENEITSKIGMVAMVTTCKTLIYQNLENLKEISWNSDLKMICFCFHSRWNLRMFTPSIGEKLKW